MEKIKVIRTMSYWGALIAVIGGCVTAVVRKEAMSELFGVSTFVFLAIGIFIDFVTEIINKSDL